MAQPKEYKDTRTGRRVWIDPDTNDEVTGPNIPKKVIDYGALREKEVGKEESVFDRIDRPVTHPDDIFYNKFGRFVPGMATTIGSAIGSFTPNPVVGSLAGTALGTAFGQGLREVSPRKFGNPSETPVQDLLINSGIDLALSGAGKAAGLVFPSARQRLGEAVAKKFFKPRVSDEVMDAISSDPNFKYTLGQVNPTAAFAERTFGTPEKSIFEQEQKKLLRDRFFTGKVNPEIVVKREAENANTYLKQEQGIRDAFYAAFEPDVVKGTRPVSIKVGVDAKGNPKYKATRVQGAVEADASFNFAMNADKELQKSLGPTLVNPAYSGSGVGVKLANLRTELDKIKSIQVDDLSGKRFDEYHRLKDLKTALNDLIYDKGFAQAGASREIGVMKGLASTIDADIENTVKSWGPQAYARYTRAQNKAKEIALKLEPDAAKMLLQAGADPNTTLLQVGREAISDPQKTRQMIAISGGDKTGAQELFVDKMIRSSEDPNKSGFLDPASGLRFLNDVNNELVAKEVLGSASRNELKRHFLRASIIGDSAKAQNVALKYTEGRAAIGIAASLIIGGFSGNIHEYPAAAGTLILLGSAGSQRFVKNVLMNPKTARIATENLSLSPLSQRAKRGTQAMLAALKFAHAKYQTPDGREYDAEITKDGRVKILD